jgi:hypothetical protein
MSEADDAELVDPASMTEVPADVGADPEEEEAACLAFDGLGTTM